MEGRQLRCNDQGASAEDYRRTATRLAEMGDLAGALRGYDCAISLDASDWRPAIQCVMTLAQLRRFEQARADIRLAKELEPDLLLGSSVISAMDNRAYVWWLQLQFRQYRAILQQYWNEPTSVPQA